MCCALQSRLRLRYTFGMGRSEPSRSCRCRLGLFLSVSLRCCASPSPSLLLSSSLSSPLLSCLRDATLAGCVCSEFGELSTTFHHRNSASFRRDFCVKKKKQNKLLFLYIFLPVCVKRKTVCVINEANDVNDADPDDDRGRLGYLLMLITNDLCNSPQNSHDFSAKNKQQKTATTTRDNVCIVSIFLVISLYFYFRFDLQSHFHLCSCFILFFFSSRAVCIYFVFIFKTSDRQTAAENRATKWH